MVESQSATALAPWRPALARALHRNRSLVYARYLQLATVRPDGRPANRTVVFRGFLKDADCLQMVTDARSNKVAQVAAQPWAEACWYFPNSREQFRLNGHLSCIGAEAAEADLRLRRQAWQALSATARTQFTWPTPAQPRQSERAFPDTPPDAAEPLTEFCLLLLEPVSVDHLELRGEPQNRTCYQLSGFESWSIQILNP